MFVVFIDYIFIVVLILWSFFAFIAQLADVELSWRNGRFVRVSPRALSLALYPVQAASQLLHSTSTINVDADNDDDINEDGLFIHCEYECFFFFF